MEQQTPPPAYQPTQTPPPVQPPAPIMPSPTAPPASSMRAVWMMLGAVVLLGAGVFAWSQLAPSAPLAEESPSATIESSEEGLVRVAIENVLKQQAIQNIRLLSLDIRGGAITMNFSKEIVSQGQAAFEQIFILVSNAINPFVQGTEVTYEVYIDGVGVGEVFQ